MTKRGGRDAALFLCNPPSFRRTPESPFVIALKGRPVHSTGQRPVTALPINQAL
ncbi:MAG: hypothetical protein ACR2P4_10495 [Gammaproteobacteria bacterium]